MRIFMTKWFVKFARREGIADMVCWGPSSGSSAAQSMQI